ncbi:hypothetical protein L1887_13848 [Cichorium endivia]|nr:hypothetical protein L1887_13848 [Cichorium endivia]
MKLPTCKRIKPYCIAYHILISARALIRQTPSSSTNEFVISLEAELNEFQRQCVAQAEKARIDMVEPGMRFSVGACFSCRNREKEKKIEGRKNGNETSSKPARVVIEYISYHHKSRFSEKSTFKNQPSS